MIQKIDAIFTDLDGTLLNDEKNIGEKDIHTIKKLQQKGVKVFLATGRHFSMARAYSKQLNISYPTIACNGAIIYDFNLETPVISSSIPKEDVEILIKFAKENNLTFYIYTNKAMYFPKKDFEDYKDIQLYITSNTEINPDEYVITNSVDDYSIENVVKFLFPECNQEMYNKLLKTDIARSGKLEIAYSGENFLDINVDGNTKGSGIKYLTRKYNISVENTLVMGDNFNDIPMLSLSGCPVVPENACEEIKKYAKFITSNNNDNPLTYAIENLFAKILK